jgi:hypothetical protein
MVFYGVASILRGYLIFRSGYLPKALGTLLALAGLGFVIRNFALVLMPAYASDVLLLPMSIAALSHFATSTPFARNQTVIGRRHAPNDCHRPSSERNARRGERARRLFALVVGGLRQRRVALAMEVLPAEAQAKIDRLMSAEKWDSPLATEIMRLADWPYVEYREILHAVWQANRTPADTPPMMLIALGPPQDWRAKGIRYDELMARSPETATDPRRMAEWEKRAAELSHPFQRRGFERVMNWRSNCGSP